MDLGGHPPQDGRVYVLRTIGGSHNDHLTKYTFNQIYIQTETAKKHFIDHLIVYVQDSHVLRRLWREIGFKRVANRGGFKNKIPILIDFRSGSFCVESADIWDRLQSPPQP